MNLQKEAMIILGLLQADFHDLNINYYLPRIKKELERIVDVATGEVHIRWAREVQAACRDVHGPWDSELSGKQNAQNVANAIRERLLHG